LLSQNRYAWKRWMIGKILCGILLNNRDWPVASAALAIIMLAIPPDHFLPL
jgi:ABC-type spermidine/putrescine transport system permease subunit I